MGFLKEIFEVIKDVKDLKKEDLFTNFKKEKYSSISKKSMEGILQFPVLVSKSLDIDTVQKVTKALERNYASFVQVTLTMNPFLNIEKDNIEDYLKSFHQNSTELDSFKSLLNISNEGYVLQTNDGEHKVLLTGIVCEGTTNKISLMNKEMLQTIYESLRTDILNDKFIPRKLHMLKNDNLNSYYNKIVTESDKEKTINMNLPNEILKNNDAKKANELVPTTMHVRLVLQNSNHEVQGSLDFIIGIKATMHPIPSNEMVTNLLNAIRNKGTVFNFVRWTTGEISFFKDFLFNINEMKEDIVNRSENKMSSWWITLKRRKSLSKIRNFLGGKGRLLPNATIVISMEEAEYIRSRFGYDLMDESLVRKIMDTYFLLGFVVVDNSSQIVHFLFDGISNYQSVTFSGLETGTRKDNELKEILKLVQRI